MFNCDNQPIVCEEHHKKVLYDKLKLQEENMDLKYELEQLQIKLDNISRELISRTDKLTSAYKKIDKLKKNNDRKQKIIEKKQRIIDHLDKEAQKYFDDMLELSYKLQSKEDLLKAIMNYVNNLGK